MLVQLFERRVRYLSGKQHARKCQQKGLAVEDTYPLQLLETMRCNTSSTETMKPNTASIETPMVEEESSQDSDKTDLEEGEIVGSFTLVNGPCISEFFPVELNLSGTF